MSDLSGNMQKNYSEAKKLTRFGRFLSPRLSLYRHIPQDMPRMPHTIHRTTPCRNGR